MKKVFKVALIVVGLILIGIVSMYAYYGGFRKVVFGAMETGGEMFVYQDVMGSYDQTPAAMDKVYNGLITGFGIEATRGAGIYYDKPGTVEEDAMRSEVGCILDYVPDSLTMARISEQFAIKQLPKGEYVVGEFPYRGSMSVVMGIMRAYPALKRYVEENNYYYAGPVTEIYDMPGKVIIYRQEVE